MFLSLPIGARTDRSPLQSHLTLEWMQIVPIAGKIILVNWFQWFFWPVTLWPQLWVVVFQKQQDTFFLSCDLAIVKTVKFHFFFVVYCLWFFLFLLSFNFLVFFIWVFCAQGVIKCSGCHLFFYASKGQAVPLQLRLRAALCALQPCFFIQGAVWGKLTWLHTKIVTCLCLRRLFFFPSERCFGSTLRSIWFPACDQ